MIPHPFLVAVHWLNVELWGPGWANILMPSIWTLLGILVADLRNRKRHNRQKNHVLENNAVLNDLAGQIEALSDKLVALMGGKDDDNE